MNICNLVGRLVKQPEVKQTQSGIANCQFTLAVNRKYKGANGEKQADFINCVAWKEVAELLGKYCDKGHQIGITGEIQTRTYDDKNGVKHYVTEVVVNQLYFLESKQSGQAQQNQQSYQNNVSPNSFNQPKPQQGNPFKEDNQFDISSDDLPF